MRVVKVILPLALLAVIAAACSTVTTARITNLTPGQFNRNSSGLYPVEAALTSSQQVLRWDTIQASVVTDNGDKYPMRHTPLMTNRWETVVPVPAGTPDVYYHVRFDYEYQGFGRTNFDSFDSKTYRLQIIDK